MDFLKPITSTIYTPFFSFSLFIFEIFFTISHENKAILFDNYSEHRTLNELEPRRKLRFHQNLSINMMAVFFFVLFICARPLNSQMNIIKFISACVWFVTYIGLSFDSVSCDFHFWRWCFSLSITAKKCVRCYAVQLQNSIDIRIHVRNDTKNCSSIK